MAYIKVLCDDRYDQNLTYQIEGEEVGNYNGDPCEKCAKYADCQGWAQVFDRCGGCNG